MKPAPFEYYAPRTLEEALDLLAAREDAKPLAGGQSLIPALNFRLARPAALVDLGNIAELRYVRRDNGTLLLGAMTRHVTLEHDESVAAAAPLVREAMPHVAHPQIRNRGTLGGSLAHADPAAELPAVMVTLGAAFVVRSRSGERTVQAAEFFTGLFATALAPGELLVEVRVPVLSPRTGWAFDEVARRHGDFALAGVAAAVTSSEGGVCTSARITLLSVGDGPMRASGAEQALIGRAADAKAIADAAEEAIRELEPPSDIHASGGYRKSLVRVLVKRVVERAVKRAAGGGRSG
ncbi:MAG TPA: xanthine dehydrogenase family protein subunit M [Gemmatimonadales bacterium]|nr:xanthine dehydrogenase family protein subunit M [Gemmatimonadales bacterium]